MCRGEWSGTSQETSGSSIPTPRHRPGSGRPGSRPLPETAAWNREALDELFALTRADGVGPKLATRIVNELKDKAAGFSLGAELAASKPGAAAPAAPVDAGPVEDAVSALVNLGYGRSDAYGAVVAASRSLGEGAALDRLISTSLRELAS